MSSCDVTAARQFVEREGRLLERRILETLHDDAPADGAVNALLAYRNDDGGFGHGLEPDTRCPASLPIYVECALDVLVALAEREAGVGGESLLPATIFEDACDWLESVATPEGAVPLAFPVIEEYPRAGHWTEWTYQPALNPTAGIVGRLHALGVEHRWVDAATQWVWAQLDGEISADAHTLSEVAVFLNAVPDRARAEAALPRLGSLLKGAAMFHLDPSADGYGLTPVHLAPTPASACRSLFSDDLIDGHLDVLAQAQQADGGWAIAWEAPSVAAAQEWRGIETLRALRTLAAYGRLIL